MPFNLISLEKYVYLLLAMFQENMKEKNKFYVNLYYIF